MTAVGREPANAVVMDAETRSAWRGGVGRGAAHPTPACALGAVLQLDALRLQLVTDAVGLGEVPSLTRLIAGVDFLGNQQAKNRIQRFLIFFGFVPAKVESEKQATGSQLDRKSTRLNSSH